MLKLTNRMTPTFEETITICFGSEKPLSNELRMLAAQSADRTLTMMYAQSHNVSELAAILNVRALRWICKMLRMNRLQGIRIMSAVFM